MSYNNETEVFKTAPLPFQGQKRNFVREFKTALQEMRAKREFTTVVDLFGGSGLLSHTAKRTCPDLRVIYNDYDDYHLRIGSVDKTNDILEKIREIVADHPRGVKIGGALRRRIIDIIEQADREGFVDYISISTSILFTMKYAMDLEALKKQTLYNRVRKDGFLTRGYLDGIEVVKHDYKELFEQYRYRGDVLFVVDPPYLSTDCSTYRSDNYWKLRDYLDVLHVLQSGNYIYFTSNKSQIVELCDWFAENYRLNTPFSCANVISHKVKGHVLNYTDVMYYKVNK